MAANVPVISRIIQRPINGKVELYENWLKEIIPVAKSFSGHRGVNIIKPQAPNEDYTIILHFESEDELVAWLSSPVRLGLLEKIRPYLSHEEEIEIQTGLEYWFTPPAAAVAVTRVNAKPYKQFLITLSAIFPLTQIIPLLLKPVFEVIHMPDIPIFKGFIIASIIVGLMVYVIMPRYTKMMAFWLYKS